LGDSQTRQTIQVSKTGSNFRSGINSKSREIFFEGLNLGVDEEDKAPEIVTIEESQEHDIGKNVIKH